MFDKEDRQEIRQGYWLTSKYGLLTVVLVIAVSLVYAFYINPLFVNADTKAYRNSIQYQTTKETMLVDKLEQCRGIEADERKLAQGNPGLMKQFEDQRAVLLRQMRMEVDRIGSDKAPADVVKYLAENPR